MKRNNIYNGDCLAVMKGFPDESITAIVTDPPYGLKFMSKKWDYDIPSVEMFKEMLRIMKPGGYLLCFGGSRTFHRMAVNIEDSGFFIKDTIMYLYGSGFPKSHNIANSIDKKNGCGNRGHAVSSGSKIHPTTGKERPNGELLDEYKARTEQGKKWKGYGSALKPAFEPIILAQKPLSGTYAENALEHGCGGLNIDECRVETNDDLSRKLTEAKGWKNSSKQNGSINEDWKKGRFPANVIIDEAVAEDMDSKLPLRCSGGNNKNITKTDKGFMTSPRNLFEQFNDGGNVSRYFYTAKASPSERADINNHPTVKPLDLMKYLVRLIKQPEDNLILDPFAGSGTTLVACKANQVDYIGIEREPEYIDIINKRLKKAVQYELL